jgi:hypothetical protein
MSLVTEFNRPAALAVTEASSQPTKRPAPFSLRLSTVERDRLVADANGLALGAYIKSRLFGTEPSGRVRRKGLPIQDREAHAQALALLGRSHLASNLNQLARAANIGTLPITPETEADLRAALQAVADIRRLLLAALGLKPEAAP